MLSQSQQVAAVEGSPALPPDASLPPAPMDEIMDNQEEPEEAEEFVEDEEDPVDGRSGGSADNYDATQPQPT